VGPQGRVVTLEFDPRHAEVAAANLRRAGVDDRVEIIVGAALDTLPGLSGEFDFAFIDADKENNSAYLQWAIDLGRPGCVIVVDNVVRNGRILQPAPEDLQATAVREMLEMMGRHPRLAAAAVQTVGLKGWDGFAIALVR
jgi:predicted O-methyltransferase YrrM